MTQININNLTVEYPIDTGMLRVIDDLSLILDTSEITVILGRSGCGKTTLLRMIKALEKPDFGTIDRQGLNIGMVFQEARLLPWLNVFKNVAFAREEYENNEINSYIDMVGLSDFKNSYPNQISGGMKSRVSLIQCLATEPDYVLMDEPFAALDYFTRMTMQDLLLELQLRAKFGVLMVTHNIDEALRIANRILIMKKGVISEEYSLTNKDKDPFGREYASIKKKILEELS